MKYIIALLIVATVLILTYTFLPGGSENEDYADRIRQHRNEIDAFMRNDPGSPFIRDPDTEYDSLDYYAVDPDYRVEAAIIPVENPEKLILPMSDGSEAEYYTYARASFMLDNLPQEVILLKSEDYWNESWLFLPFYDETSAGETYGGGRYLEIDYDHEKTVVIDFNLAYNPYCAYTGIYSCPLPPRENKITVAVRAGEKKYSKK